MVPFGGSAALSSLAAGASFAYNKRKLISDAAEYLVELVNNGPPRTPVKGGLYGRGGRMPHTPGGPAENTRSGRQQRFESNRGLGHSSTETQTSGAMTRNVIKRPKRHRKRGRKPGHGKRKRISRRKVTFKRKRRSLKWKKKGYTYGRIGMFDDWRSGNVKSASNELQYKDIYLFAGKPITEAGKHLSASAIINDFQLGEQNTPGTATTPGLFDAPSATGSVYVLPGGVIDPTSKVLTIQAVQDDEVLIYDICKTDYYFTNTANIPVLFRIEEFLCKDSSDTFLEDRIDNLYKNQQFFANGNTHASPATVQNELSFNASKVPGLSKYWKRTRFYEAFIQPGVEMKKTFYYKKVKFNQQKFKNQNDSGAMFYNCKGVTRCIRLSCRGSLCISNSTGNGNFSKSEVAWAQHRFVRAHRARCDGAASRNWIETQTYVGHLTTAVGNLVMPTIAEISGLTGGGTATTVEPNVAV